VAADLDTFLIALYVEIDDQIAGSRRIGRSPLLGAAELVCPEVADALLGTSPGPTDYASPASLSQRPGYDKRLRAAFPLTLAARGWRGR
jgi:hypothetical protein